MQHIKISSKQVLIIVSLLLFILVIFIVFTSIDRVGKEKVSIELIPNDSTVYINNKKINSGDNYIKKGTYKFSAKKEGFKDDIQTITVPSGGISIGLTPEPISNKAKKWLQDNPNIQAQRESMGGRMASLRGSYIEKNTPIISSLPYTDTSGPFSIDYSGSNNREYGTSIVISNSLPQGRLEALRYIRQNGGDPTNLDIRYEDFKNPLLSKVVE